jgi:hypothetical protein
MADLYLIAHKVRGEPAFDVGTRMDCPECKTYEYVEHMAVAESNIPGCSECDGLGYWWIIPTSGHRAYPYWWIAINDVPDLECLFKSAAPFDPRTHIPEGIPDHYTVRADPKAPKRSLLAELGLAKPQSHPAITGKVTRRI